MIEPGKKVVLFPVEIVARELDFRLVLAALCARADTQIVIGRQHLLQQLLLHLRGGLFLGKNLASWKSPQEYRNYKDRDFRTIYLNEEGGLYEGGPEQWGKIVHESLEVERIEAEDYVCTWGEFQADCYRKLHPRCAPHILATGHPRFNLCHPRYRALYGEETGALKQRYGRFILINTNFGWNNAKGIDFNFQWFNVKPSDSERRTFYLDQFCVSAVKWARFIQLTNYLSDHFPEHQIVVRPHPAESIHIYTTLLQHVPRVTVTREGGVPGWLLACDAMIHNGCTTAIEAYQAGARVVNFRPVVDERFEVTLPNLVGISCTTEAGVEQALRQLFDGQAPETTVTPENAARIREVVNNFGFQEDAFAKLARIVHGVLDEIGPTRVTGALSVLGRHRVKDTLGRLISPLDPAVWQRRRGRQDPGYQKFPPLRREEIDRKVRRIREITGRPVFVRFHSSRLISMFLEN